MRRSVSFNIEPEVNFYKKRPAYVDPEVEPPRPFVLGPVPAAFIHAPDPPQEPLGNLFPQLLISEIEPLPQEQEQEQEQSPDSPPPPPPPPEEQERQQSPDSPQPPPPPRQEQEPESPQPPPPPPLLNLRAPAQKRLLYDDHVMSPYAHEEIDLAREQEAAVRAAAIAAAYSQFTADDTPEQHTTPTEHQPPSPFVLPPAASPLGRCEAKTPRI